MMLITSNTINYDCHELRSCSFYPDVLFMDLCAMPFELLG